MRIQLLLLSILILWMNKLKTITKKGKRNHDMISHLRSGKKAQQALKDLFIRCRKLNVSLYFLTQSYFIIPKSSDIWGLLAQFGPGLSKFLTTYNCINTTKITIFKVLNFYKKPLKFLTYKKQ